MSFGTKDQPMYPRKNIAAKRHTVLYVWDVDSKKNYFEDRFGQKNVTSKKATFT